MFISGHEHYLRLKVLRRYFQYISLGQPVCFDLIKDGGKNHESAYCSNFEQIMLEIMQTDSEFESIALKLDQKTSKMERQIDQLP